MYGVSLAANTHDHLYCGPCGVELKAHCEVMPGYGALGVVQDTGQALERRAVVGGLAPSSSARRERIGGA